MFESDKENISLREDENSLMLTLFSQEIKVGIVGGGKAALIKAKTLFKGGSKVYVLAKEYIKEFFLEFQDKLGDIELIQGEYNEDFITDKHIIVIALDSEEIVEKISEDCKKLSKIFINCKDGSKGVAKLPAQRNGENFSVAVSIKNGNPKGAVYGVEKAREVLNSYNEYFKVSTKLRNRIKDLKYNKKEMLNFIGEEDFIFFMEKKRDKNVLKIFYDIEIIENLYKD